jgi:predicted Zn-dependent peptidase
MLSLYHTFTGPPNHGFIKPCRKPVAHLLKAVDGVTLKDVATVAEKIISSPLTMASHGNGKFISK